MDKILNGKIVKMTEQEIKEIELYKKEYYLNTSYDDLVNDKIRERYSLSEELAISRQRLEKPNEFKTYYDYCEECKRIVKEAQNVENKIL